MTAPSAGFPTDAVSFEPPVSYEMWWAWTESCAGRVGAFDRVRWYVVSSNAVVVDGTSYDAYWFADGDRIVLAEQYRNNGAIVRHEMLHALLVSGRHPTEYFRRRCLGVVECSETCRAG